MKREIELEKKINQLKMELVRIAKAYGLSNAKTLNCSQKLDDLITVYQKSKSSLAKT